MNRISIAGCGLMGSALIRTLAGQGQEVVVWNRTPGKAEALALPGVSVAPSFGEALSSCSLMILILADPGYAASAHLLEESGDALAGKLVIQLSTGGDDDARRLDALVKRFGGRYLDGAILVDPAAIGKPESCIIYSGDPAGFEAAKPVLERLASARFVGDEAATAAILELTLNIACLPMEVGFLQARRICESRQLPLERFDSLVQWFLTNHLGRLLQWMKQSPGSMRSGATVSLLAELSAAVAGHVREQGDIDPGMFDALASLYEAGVAAGRGSDDSLCVAELRART